MYIHDFVPCMVRLSNGIGMHFKQDRGEKFVVHFCQAYISYTFNGYKHTLTHYPTIRYMYHLMSLMTYVSWIRVVVKKCYDIVVPSLTEMALKKLKFIPGRNESTMRRMLDPPFTTCKYFLHYGSAMHSRGAPPTGPNGTQFLHFCIDICRKVPMSEAAPQRVGAPPPTGNPGSATALKRKLTTITADVS